MSFPARCPMCGGREVGRVGASQYYCWDCCIEFAVSRRGPRMFRLEPDGSLITIPPGEASRPQEARARAMGAAGGGLFEP